MMQLHILTYQHTNLLLPHPIVSPEVVGTKGVLFVELNISEGYVLYSPNLISDALFVVLFEDDMCADVKRRGMLSCVCAP